MLWNELSIGDKANYIKLAVTNGVTNLDDIRDIYNSYAEGGIKRSVKVVGTSGKDYGEFNTRKDADNYISTEGLEPVFKEELPEFVYTKPKSLLLVGSDNFKETFGVTPKDVASFIPYVGDALDIKDIGTDLQNKKYKEAGIGALALLLPNIIEKPAKALYKGFKKGLFETATYIDDIVKWPQTLKAIKEHRYVPFMSKAQRDNYRETVKKRMLEEVLPFTRLIVVNNVEKRNLNGTSDIFASYPGILEPYMSYPTVSLYRDLLRNGRLNGGDYDPVENHIRLNTRESIFGKHRFRDIEQILGTGAHEYSHFWSELYPKIRDLTIPEGTYYGPNMNNKDVTIFSPIFKYKPGSWKRSPDEVIAEIFKQKWLTRNPEVIKSNSPHLSKVSDYIAKRFGLTKEEATKMVLDLGEKGYKYGGSIK